MVGPLHRCTDDVHPCEARQVNNNLGCGFGSPNPNIPYCDINLVRSLAASAPAEDIAIVLVNDPIPGGVATDGLVYITNDATFMSYMLVHYLNRAVASLQEEYDMGIANISGQYTFAAPNCAGSSDEMNEKWSYWYGNSSLSSPSSGAAGCSMTSYSPPTGVGCLMRNSSISAMCSVCKESLILSFLGPGVSESVLSHPSTAPLNLAAGRCPSHDYVSYVGSSESATIGGPTAELFLSLGEYAYQSDVETTWYADDGTILATGTQVLHVANTSSWTLPTTVTAVVVDATSYVRPAWRDAGNFSKTVRFTVLEWNQNIQCEETPACFSSTAAFAAASALPGSVCVAAAPSLARHTAGALEALPTSDMTVRQPQSSKTLIIALSVSIGGFAVLLLAGIFVLFFYKVDRRPREVLNVLTTHRLLYIFVVVVCCISFILSTVCILLVVAYVPHRLYHYTPIFVTLLSFGAVGYITAPLNLIFVLQRWYRCCFAAGIFAFFIGFGFFVPGVLSIKNLAQWQTRQYSDQLGELWMTMVTSDTGSSYLCNVQQDLKCSGYRASCFMTLSSECPLDCNTNVYSSACEAPFMKFFRDRDLPLGVVGVICGLLFMIQGVFVVLYQILYTNLSHAGRVRRSYRMQLRPLVAPITYYEATELRRYFLYVCNPEYCTLEAKAAVDFLKTVFAEPLSASYEKQLMRRGPLTFDALMSLHFPCVRAADRNLRWPECNPGASAVNNQKTAVAGVVEGSSPKMARVPTELFVEAAGALSPEILQAVFLIEGQKSPLPTEGDLMKVIQETAWDCDATPCCHGLLPREALGLRGVWAAVHPSVVGCLSDAELRLFYSWTHGGVTTINDEMLQAWKNLLDYSHQGNGIGWTEFCYPFAQRSLLLAAQQILTHFAVHVPLDVVRRETLQQCYGPAVCEQCCLPNEEVVPLQRVVAHFVETANQKETIDEKDRVAFSQATANDVLAELQKCEKG